jgi:2-(1,2-epoxy-1,2-dihydrophenyl)acetyl-CoA isomerase
MKFEFLNLEQRGAVAHLTLNRPDKLNALNLPMVEELHAAATAFAADPGIRAVLLTAAGRAFCSGADLTRDDFFKDKTQSTGQNIAGALRQSFNPMVTAWSDLAVPVVVAVGGIAAGAGVSLALLGDIVLAGRSATFIELFAPKLGLMPDLGGSYFLPRILGTARAKGLALLGEPLTAPEAERWGLIWSCVEDSALIPQAEALAQRLAAGPTQSYKRIKALFNQEPTTTLTEQLELEAVLQGELADTQDFAEGIAAFVAKRPPAFKGV